MQLFPNLATDQKRSCAGCRQLVAREDCHRNRYGEYICKSCQSKGIRFTWPNRLRDYLRRTFFTLSVVAISGALASLVLWGFYSMFLHLNIFKVFFG